MTSDDDAGDKGLNFKTKCIQLYLPLPPHQHEEKTGFIF